jgi:predicted nucleotidyltransferase
MTDDRSMNGRRNGHTITGVFDEILPEVQAACEAVYGPRLRALVVFGSVGRGTPGPESDIDLLVVAEGLPNGRYRRVREFAAVEERLADSVRVAAKRGVHTALSPVFKSEDELRRGSPLLLDMVDDARVLVDRNDTFEKVINRLRARLTELGARRVWRGSAWFWDLKPDYRPGEIFEL